MTGLSFPLALNPYGQFATDNNDDDLWESRVGFTLATRVGERIGRPEFGIDLRAVLFSDDTERSRETLREQIEQVFARDLAEVSLSSITFDESGLDGGALNIDIQWALPTGVDHVDSLTIPTDNLGATL